MPAVSAAEAQLLHRIEVESLGGDLFQAVSRHVPRGSSCLPVVCADGFDTHLLCTYCHAICDETFREPMLFHAMVLGAGSAHLVRVRLPYQQSQCLSLKPLLNQSDLRGVCFAWTEREGHPAGFCVDHHRLAPIFYAYYQSRRIRRTLDCVHSSASRNNYARERIFWVPKDGARVTAIVCAPWDAYQHRPTRLTYTFGLKEGSAPWRYVTQAVAFVPSLWVDLGELFEVEFKTSSRYLYFVRGPKGKGWLLTQTTDDFNLHHL